MKVNEIVHVANGMSPVQLLAEIANVPVIVGPDSVIVALPVLVMVSVSGLLVLATICAGNVKLAALGENTGASAARMFSVAPCVALGAVPLNACTVNELEPAAVGMPDSTPPVLSVKPAGSVPVTTDHVAGVPVAVNVKL